jgi:hypothetical protein
MAAFVAMPFAVDFVVEVFYYVNTFAAMLALGAFAVGGCGSEFGEVGHGSFPLV